MRQYTRFLRSLYERLPGFLGIAFPIATSQACLPSLQVLRPRFNRPFLNQNAPTLLNVRHNAVRKSRPFEAQINGTGERDDGHGPVEPQGRGLVPC
jgi:hypothetical protein